MCYINDSESYIPSFNITVGHECYVVTNYQTKEIHRFHFGLTGISNEPVPFVRAEGDRNLSDNPNYTGLKAIFLKSEYSNFIRNQRCLVLADAFVAGINTTPYLVYLRNKQRPFAFAGIWNKHKNETGEEVYSFAIITVTANKLLHKLGYKRMPVILYHGSESGWLRASSQLNDILYMLSSFPANLMNAYPVSNKIADITKNDKTLILPIGKPILKEPEYTIMKRARKQKEDHFPDITLADIMKKGK